MILDFNQGLSEIYILQNKTKIISVEMKLH